MTAIPFDIDTISIYVQSVHFKYCCATKVHLILTIVIDYSLCFLIACCCCAYRLTCLDEC